MPTELMVVGGIVLVMVGLVIGGKLLRGGGNKPSA